MANETSNKTQRAPEGKTRNHNMYEVFVESAQRFDKGKRQLVSFNARVRNDVESDNSKRAGKYAVTNLAKDDKGVTHQYHSTIWSKNTYDRVMEKMGFDKSPADPGQFLGKDTPANHTPRFQTNIQGYGADGKPASGDKASRFALVAKNAEPSKRKTFSRNKNTELRREVNRERAAEAKAASAKAAKGAEKTADQAEPEAMPDF